MNADFDVFNKFKGFGNPKGDYWFIGLEEGKEISSKVMDAKILSYSRDYFPFEEKSEYTPVYDIISKIVNGLKNWSRYRDNDLARKNSLEFIMNLYPLGKKKLTTWPILYSERFGFKSQNEYLKLSKTKRFKELRAFRNIHNPKITICHGASGWKDFRELLEVEINENKSPYSWMEYYPKSKIILTPFFWNPGMSTQKIEALRNLIERELLNN